MSLAIREPQFQARLHPLVKLAAQAIGRSGTWHMSNAYRPACPGTLTHQLGISLDVAPISYAVGGFWLRTAAMILAFVQRATKHTNWCAVAEKDHVHLSLANRPAIGVNTSSGTQLFEPETQQRLNLERIMNDEIVLSDAPMGDLLHGDLHLTSGDVGMGDLLLSAGDLAAGDLDTRILQLAEEGDVNQKTQAIARLRALPPAKKDVANMERALKQHRRSVGVPYFLVSKGAEVRKSSVGTQARMSAAEAALIRDDLFLIPQVDPVAVTVPYVGPNYVDNLTARLATLFPTLPPEVPVRYVGSIIVITANPLTYVPDIAANITIALGTALVGALPVTISLTVQLAPGKQGSTRIYIPIAALSVARARLLRGFLFPDAAAVVPAATILTISGLPEQYVVTHSFMFLEDSFTNKYTSMLPG